MSRSFLTLISVFFFWGFVAASNTILIGLFKKNFELTQFQSQLVDLAFYTAYFVGSLIYFILSLSTGDPLNKIGYKKGLIVGLTISAIGAFGFIPAANMQSFPVMLASLFTIGLGFALQQIVANPYVIALGKPETGAHRVSLAGGINSFGTTIGPLLVALAIYGGLGESNNAEFKTNRLKNNLDHVTVYENESVERTSNKSQKLAGPVLNMERLGLPQGHALSYEGQAFLYGGNSGYEHAYAFCLKNPGKILGLVIVKNNDANEKELQALKEKYRNEKMPIISIKDADPRQLLEVTGISADDAAYLKVNLLGVDAIKLPSTILGISFLLFSVILLLSKLPPITNTEKMEKSLGALKYPQVILGMIAIFVYVGVEVTVQSNLPALMQQPDILGLPADKTVHFISLYWGCLMIGRWVGALSAFNLSPQKNKLLTLVVPVLAFGVIAGVNFIKGSPVNDILLFAPFILLLIAGFFLSGGKPARTMIIFGSMAAVMMLIGMVTHGKIALYSFISGGLFCSVMWPCIFSLSIAGLGKYTTQASSLLVMMILGGAFIPPFQGYLSDKIGIHVSYFVPVICFLFLAWYGWKVKKALSKQGINYDEGGSGH